ncbi:MAG: CBS domain-containing protein [Desulfobacterales bacterium]|nr:CBS domain-containing protein [Desulfobacterales bacterium]
MINQPTDSCILDISDEDILKAMKDINGYLDITPRDFKEIYLSAYRHAIERLTHAVTAGDIMTRAVVYVEKDSPLEDAADKLSHHLVSGVPVVDSNQKVVGIISEKDFFAGMGGQTEGTFMGVIAQCLKNKGCIAVPMRTQKASDIMTSPAITVRENTPVFEIAKIFTGKKINRIPVVGEGNRLTGIVTRTDIVRSSCTLPV